MSSSPSRLQLASQSPRRREILDQIGVSYQLVTATIDESAKLNESGDELVVRLAEEKAKAGYEISPLAPTLGADTVVVFDNRVFGKPVDADDSFRMLSMLSGTEHEVLSAVAVFDGNTLLSAISRSKVQFRALSDDEIRKYWSTGEPCDKAGSYAIQGKAAVFVDSLDGSYSGVMGLPIAETVMLLNRFDIAYWQ